jgi:uroporphyrinogen-III synthase
MTLAGLNILVPESRELDLLTAMLKGEGAAVLRCPLVKILDLEDTRDAEAWINEVIAGRFNDIIWLTGEGLRRLVSIVRVMERQHAFVTALGRARNITRGPKPARALRELGLTPGLIPATLTSQGVLEVLASHDIAGRNIGVQLYPGDGAMPLLAALQTRGARLWSVTPYRYAPETDSTEVIRVVSCLAEGTIDLVIFTATPQVDRLFHVARETGLERELRNALARTPVAAIGPVVERTLSQHGVTPALRPDSSFHLKPLMRAVMTWRVGVSAAAMPCPAPHSINTPADLGP